MQKPLVPELPQSLRCPFRHPRESGDPSRALTARGTRGRWVPAFAGMTEAVERAAGGRARMSIQPSVPLDAVYGCPPRSRGPRVVRLSSRSEEHTSELQSLMRISYAVF